MKNILSIVCLFVFLYANNLISQDNGLIPQPAKPQNEISVNGGITSSTISGSDDGVEYTENMNISVIYGTPLNKDIKFYFGLELLNLGNENNESNTTEIFGQKITTESFYYNTFGHINIPLNFGYIINSGKLQVIPKVGANISYLYSMSSFARIKVSSSQETQVEERTQDLTSEEIDEQANRLGLLLNVAIDFRYEINKQFQIKFEPRYGSSILNIAKNTDGSYKHDFIGLNLGVVYNF